MSLQVEKLEQNMAKLTIEVPASRCRKSTSECVYRSRRTKSVCRDSVKEKFHVR